MLPTSTRDLKKVQQSAGKMQKRLQKLVTERVDLGREGLRLVALEEDSLRKRAVEEPDHDEVLRGARRVQRMREISDRLLVIKLEIDSIHEEALDLGIRREAITEFQKHRDTAPPFNFPRS